VIAVEREPVTMAKKKTPPAKPATPSSRVSPAYLRRGTVSVKDLQKLIATCQKHLTDAETLLREGAASGVEEFELDGVTKLPRTERLLKHFAGKIFNGIRDAKLAKEQ
jgi:hypothetical protein